MRANRDDSGLARARLQGNGPRPHSNRRASPAGPTAIRARPRMSFAAPPEAVTAFNINIERSENQKLMFSIRAPGTNMDPLDLHRAAFMAAYEAISMTATENISWEAVRVGKVTSKAGAEWWYVTIEGDPTQIRALRAHTHANTVGHLVVTLAGGKGGCALAPCPHRVPTDPMYLVRINSTPDEDVFTPEWMKTILETLAEKYQQEQLKVMWVVKLGSRGEESGTPLPPLPGSLRNLLNPAEAKPGRCFALVHGGHKLLKEASDVGFLVTGCSKEVRGYMHKTTLLVNKPNPPPNTGGDSPPEADPPSAPLSYAGAARAHYTQSGDALKAMVAAAQAAADATMRVQFGPYPGPPPRLPLGTVAVEQPKEQQPAPPTTLPLAEGAAPRG